MQQLDERFQGILWMRNAAVTMMEMKENVYDVEDELLLQFDKIRAQLYTLQLQPFIEMRELAYDQLGKYKGTCCLLLIHLSVRPLVSRLLLLLLLILF